MAGLDKMIFKEVVDDQMISLLCLAMTMAFRPLGIHGGSVPDTAVCGERAEL